MTAALLGALSWEPQIKGALYVLLAVVILVGSTFLILGTDVGSRLGFQLTAAGLFGLLVTLGTIWWVRGIGPVGPSPTWKTQDVITGSISQTREEALVGFPDVWRKLEPSDPEVADAQPVVDADLVIRPGEPGGAFKRSSDYLVVGAYQKGGETYGPVGLNFRPFDVFHKPNYLVVQVQQVKEHPALPGQPVAKPQADTSTPVVSVVLLRDLGSKRLNPAVFTISCALIFGLLVYQLHSRDKELLARREAAKVAAR